LRVGLGSRQPQVVTNGLLGSLVSCAAGV